MFRGGLLAAMLILGSGIAGTAASQDVPCVDEYDPVVLDILDARYEALQLQIALNQTVSDRNRLQSVQADVAEAVSKGIEAEEAARLLFAISLVRAGSGAALGDGIGPKGFADIVYKAYKTIRPALVVPYIYEPATRAQAQEAMADFDAAMQGMDALIDDIKSRVADNEDRIAALEKQRDENIARCAAQLGQVGGAGILHYSVHAGPEGFRQTSGDTEIGRGQTLTVLDLMGGCGPNDTAACLMNETGDVAAYYRDSCAPAEVYGPWVSSGCSTADYNGYWAKCCFVGSE